MHLFKFISAAVLATTTAANAIPDRAAFAGYLFSTFTDANHTGLQYLSQGNTPYAFRPIKGGNPVVTSDVGTRGIRDLYLTTNPARSEWYLLATDLDIRAPNFSWDKATRHGSRGLVIWKSTNLVDWTGGNLITVETDTAGMAWAPSAVWDDATGQWFVFWAARHFAANDPAHTGTATLNKIRYSTTQDFVTFTVPTDYLAIPGTGIIDQEFQYLGTPGHFARFIKDETVGLVYRETTTGGLFGSWSRVPGYVTDRFDHEGALSFQDNNDPNLYHLFIDDYAQYIPYETTQILEGSYIPSAAGELPYGLKHGSVTPLTQAEYDAITARYPA